MNSKIWLIGDTHFYHRNIIDYCDRPFETVEEMNNFLIKNWNFCIGKNDIVYMMGDFALCGKDKIIEIGKKLNGRKRLILGNHDGASLSTYREAGFEYIYDHPIILDDFFIISHTPQFTQNNGVYVNIHAHTHNDPKFKRISTHSFCTSVELNDYKPILFEEVKKLIFIERNKK